MLQTKSRVHRTIFENGLTIITERAPQFRSLAMGISVRFGSRDEPSEKSGVAHFIEHMLFKGTHKRDALTIVQEIERRGGEFNAFTARDNTCFHVLMLDRDLEVGADILTDILLNSTFQSKEVLRERKVILQEIAMVEDSPEETAFDLFYEKVYGRKGLGSAITGTRSTVRGISRKTLLKFFCGFYRPENTVISLAGNVSHAKALRAFKRLGARAWPGRETPASQLLPAVYDPPRMREGRWWKRQPTEQVHVVWGVEAPDYSSPERITASLLGVYLGGGMSSYLFQEVREKKGLAYSVYSNYTPFVDTGAFTIYVACGKPDLFQCISLIEKGLEKVAREPLSTKAFTQIQENLKGAVLLSADSVESRMMAAAQHEMFQGTLLTASEICQKIDETTPEAMQSLAATLLKRPKSLFAMGSGSPPRGFVSS